jgi:GNAT superfamily N-acetyltransferase
MIKIEKNIPVDIFFRDIFDLCELHWEELANNKDAIKLNPDINKYTVLQQSGSLANAVIYDDEKIVGYTVLIVTPHLHYQNDKYAYVDVLFLKPDYRNSRLGLKLVDLSEELARDFGASIILHHVKPHHPTLAKIIQKKGFKHAETVYGKLLED